MKYKLAIIGTGKIAGVFDTPSREGVFSHAKACSKLKRINLKAACDIDAKRLNGFCRTWGIKSKYLHLDELLDKEKPDIISLCTPSQTHFALTKKILQHVNRPRILLVEKPLCLRRQELAKLNKILAGVNTELIVDHTYRFNAGLQKIASMIKRGDLGRMLSIRAVYYGGLLNNGVHLLDTLRMLTGSEFRIISAKVGAGGRGDDFCVDAELRLKNCLKSKVILESFTEKYYQLYEIEIRLSAGRIRVTDFGKDIFIDKVRINNKRERELKNTGKVTLSRDGFPLIILFKKIIAYLSRRDSLALSGIGIKEIDKTMNYLWKMRDEALR